MTMSPTSEVTMLPKAAPMMTPTARSTTLPFIAKSRNSLSILRALLFSLPNKNGHGNRVENSVDQTRMNHRAADRDARRLGHRHHRQSQRLLHLAEQRQRILDRGRIGLDEKVVSQRHQLVVQLECGCGVALLPGLVKLRTQARRHVGGHRNTAMAAMGH